MSEWRRYRRTGTVTARRLTEPLHWTTDGGDVLDGEAGDWRVTDGHREWTVKDPEFQVSYEPVQDLFRRRGEVEARPGVPGEVIPTLEGDVVVRPGDWVVRGERGEVWPVPEGRFRTAYEQLDATRSERQ